MNANPIPLTTFHIGADEGNPLYASGLQTVLKVSGDQTQGTVAVVEHVLAPGFLGAPLHTHLRENEISFVLEGELTVQVGEEIVTAHAGATLVQPRGILHTFWNSGSTPVRFLEMISPSGFEQYFVELDRIIPRSGMPDMNALVALRRKYGLQIDASRLSELILRYDLRLI